jgi:hypothetical protein
MPPVEFEPTIPASALPQTYTLDRAATVISSIRIYILSLISALGGGEW